MAPTQAPDNDSVFGNVTSFSNHFDIPSRFQNEADYIDFLYGPQQSTLANFVYSPKVKYAWVILIFSCILDRLFPGSASPLPKRLSKHLSHAKLFVVCVYPLAAAGHILSYPRDITEELFVPRIPEPFMDALIIIRLFNVLGGVLAASWMFGAVNSRGALPFPIFLFASIALPFSIHRWATFTIELSCERSIDKFVSPETVLIVMDTLPVLYSLYRYFHNGLFNRSRRHRLLIFLALFACWLCTLALSWLLEFRFWDTLLRHAYGIGPRPTCAYRPFPSLPSSMQPSVSRYNVYLALPSSESHPQPEFSHEKYALGFEFLASVLFTGNLCNLDEEQVTVMDNAWYFVAFHASLILLSAALLSAMANGTGSKWLAAAYELVQHNAMDNIWTVIRACAATMWLLEGVDPTIIWFMVLDWVTRAVIVFYRIDVYFPPQYTRFKEAQTLQMGLEWLLKALFVVSLVEAVCRAQSWVLSVLGDWRGKKTKTTRQEEEPSLPAQSDYEKGSTK